MKQNYLDPEMAPIDIEVVTIAAKEYHKLKKAHTSLGKKMHVAMDELISLMIENGLATYEYNGTIVDLLNMKKVKLKKKKHESQAFDKTE